MVLHHGPGHGRQRLRDLRAVAPRRPEMERPEMEREMEKRDEIGGAIFVSVGGWENTGARGAFSKGPCFGWWGVGFSFVLVHGGPPQK